MKTAAIVIARGGSTRLPGKNMMDFRGRPLVAHKVHQLMQCKNIDKVIVGSDCPDILAAAKAEGAEVVTRLPEFCDEKSRSWNEVIEDMASKVDADLIVWAHCTNPLIQSETYDRAIEALLSSSHANDSLVSVTRVQSHLWRNGRPFNFDPKSAVHLVAKQLEPIFYQNGGIFIAKRDDMIRWKYVYGDSPIMFEIGADEAVDIDTEADYKLALALI